MHPIRTLALLVPVVALGLAGRAHATTMVTTGSLPTQTWTPAGSPYVLIGAVNVDAGQTLTIEPGTVVQVPLFGQLTIDGTLLVQGTRANRVDFQCNVQSSCITVDEPSHVTIRGARIGGANTGVYGNGYYTIEDSIVFNNGTGLYTTVGLIANRVELYGNSEHAIVVDGAASGTLTNVIMHDQSAGVLVITGLGANLTVTNSTFYNNGAAIATLAQGNVYVSVFISNSILFQNPTVFDTSGNWDITIDHSDLTGPSPVVCTTCLSTDPKFVLNGSDFHLMPSSPCIDVGTALGAPSDDYDGNARPQGAGFDLGAFETPGTIGADAGVHDAGMPDAAVHHDAGVLPDAAVHHDAGELPDAAVHHDAGGLPDAAVHHDAGELPDAAALPDAGEHRDASVLVDASPDSADRADAGTIAGAPGGGCGCRSSDPGAAGMFGLGIALAVRRRRRLVA